jgi:hypothetical protein
MEEQGIRDNPEYDDNCDEGVAEEPHGLASSAWKPYLR